jgi:protein-S-isoprenylcysteine O-methyltransferase Ste14
MPGPTRVDAKLAARALLGLLFLVVVLAAALFVPAGTTHYPEAWTFLAIFAGCSLAITVDLMVRDPELLEHRTHAGPIAERRGHQKVIQSAASLAFVAELVVPALDHRFSWSSVPVAIVVAGDVLVAVGFLFVYLVFRANRFASGLIETTPGQKLIDTGPYALVRHPMYGGALVLLVGMPLSLGSYWGLLALVPMVASLVWRLLDEEAFLSKSLPGYDAYQRKTRYRLVPGVW